MECLTNEGNRCGGVTEQAGGPHKVRGRRGMARVIGLVALCLLVTSALTVAALARAPSEVAYFYTTSCMDCQGEMESAFRTYLRDVCLNGEAEPESYVTLVMYNLASTRGAEAFAQYADRYRLSEDERTQDSQYAFVSGVYMVGLEQMNRRLPAIMKALKEEADAAIASGLSPAQDPAATPPDAGPEEGAPDPNDAGEQGDLAVSPSPDAAGTEAPLVTPDGASKPEDLPNKDTPPTAKPTPDSSSSSSIAGSSRSRQTNDAPPAMIPSAFDTPSPSPSPSDDLSDLSDSDSWNETGKAPAPDGPASKIVYFYESDCESCEDAADYMSVALENSYDVFWEDGAVHSDVDVLRYDVSDRTNLELLLSYYKAYDVPEQEQSVPIVFVGDIYVQGNAIATQLTDIIRGGHGLLPSPFDAAQAEETTGGPGMSNWLFVIPIVLSALAFGAWWFLLRRKRV